MHVVLKRNASFLHSSVITSDRLIHSKDTIMAYLEKILEVLPEDIKVDSVWSDGPTSRFKNRFIAAAAPVLEKKHAVKVEGNCFHTSHGKGSVDGIR